MNVQTQLQRLVDMGLPSLAGRSEQEFTDLAQGLGDSDGALLVVHPSLVPASSLAPLMRRGDRGGFVVQDMPDLDEFVPIPDLGIPDRPLYLVAAPDRGDDLRNWSPAEALPEITARGRLPLTISEGICWLLQVPDRLEPNGCFMCIGSRKPTPRGLDARTPALWISGGTGRDGRDRRGAPKVGWCWHGNRHTWLGFATTRRERRPD